MNKLLFFLLFIFLFSSCKDKKTTLTDENIQIVSESSAIEEFVEDMEEFAAIPIYSSTSNYNNNLSAVAIDVDFIQLDFDPPLGEFFFLNNVELSEEYIFLSWLYDIFAYDKTGKFIRKIGSRGQGPEEFVNIASIQLEREKKLLYAEDIGRRRMAVYRFDGSFEKSFPLKTGVYCVLLDSSTFAWRQGVSERRLNPSLVIRFSAENGEDLKTYWSNHFPLNTRTQKLGPDTSPLWNYNNTFFYMEWGTDTIFRILGDSLIPARVLTGDLKMMLIEHFAENTGSKLKISTPIGQRNSGIFESNQLMIFRLSNDYERFFMVYDKKTKQLHRTYHKDAPTTRLGDKLMDYFIDDMFTGLPVNPLYQSMGKAIAFVPAHEIYAQKQAILDFIEKNNHEKSAYLKQIVQNITDDDNPLMVIGNYSASFIS